MFWFFIRRSKTAAIVQNLVYIILEKMRVEVKLKNSAVEGKEDLKDSMFRKILEWEQKWKV